MEREVISKRVRPRHQLIAEDLRQRIRSGELHPGETIPSYRTLMETHGVTVGTVRQAVLALQSDGWIESAPGVGCVVAQPRARRLMIGIAEPGHEQHDFTHGQLRLLHDELDRLNADVSVRFVPVVDDNTVASVVAWGKRLDGVLLSGRVPVRMAQTLAESGVPTVLMGEPLDGPCPPWISSVSIDIHSTVQLAMSHLTSLGHRRIVLCSYRGSRYFSLLAESFRRCAAESKLEGLVDEWYFDGCENRKQLFDFVAGRDPRPTALLVEEGTRATGVVSLFIANGWPVPERISVLGITAAVRQAESMDGLNCVLTSAREMILRGASMLPEIIASGGRLARAERIVPTYVPGRTCRLLTAEEQQV